jgi:RND superfamily putative drug exporter
MNTELQKIKPPSISSSKKKPFTVRVAAWSARNHWLVFGLWLVATIGIFAVSLAMGGTKSEGASDPSRAKNSESTQATAVYNEGVAQVDSQNFYVIVTNPTVKTSDPAFQAVVGKITQALAGAKYTDNGQSQPVFSQVINPYLVPAAAQAGLVSPDSSSVRIVATALGTGKVVDNKLEPLKPVMADLKAQNSGYQILTLNNAWINDDINEVVNHDLDNSLKITIPLTFIILLIAFGAVAAAVVPLVLAVTALLAAFGLLNIYSQLVAPVSPYATQLVVLIGLAVAVDYTLFMITRFRNERRRGRDKLTAIEISSSTAGRAVFFSGVIVMVSVAGLFILNDPLFRSMALGTIGVVLVSVIGSLTFLPAILAILGKGINWGRIPYFGRDREEGSGFWSRLVGGVMKQPVVLAVISVMVLLAIAFPVLHLKLGLSDIDSFPDQIEGVQAIKVMNTKWPQGTTLQLIVVVTQANRPEVKAAMEKLQKAGLQTRGLSQPSAINMSQNGVAGEVTWTMGGSMNDPANHDLVNKMRQELIPANLAGLGVQAYVGGDAALVVDVVNTYTQAMPLVFAFVLGLSFLILLIAFHSIVIPVTAILLNLLSTATSYGTLVLVFQDGWFGSLLGIKQTEVIESWVPVFIFTILFGLSMDYHLFILTRIKEARDRGATSNEAVARGISVTSGVITSAASIMVVVFAVFVTLQLVIIRELGLGLAVAVFFDATVIRCVLLPSVMRILGDWNWYLPKFLDWLPRITIEAEEAEAHAEIAPAVPADKATV